MKAIFAIFNICDHIWENKPVGGSQNFVINVYDERGSHLSNLKPIGSGVFGLHALVYHQLAN